MRVRWRVWLTLGLVIAIVALSGCGGKKKIKMVVERQEVIESPTLSFIGTKPSGKVDTREAGVTVEVTLRGDEGLTATYDVDGLFKTRPMEEGPPGVYRGSFPVRQGFEGKIVVTGRLVHPPTSSVREMSDADSLSFFRSGDPEPPPAVASPPAGACTDATLGEFDAELVKLSVFFELGQDELSDEARTRLTRGAGVLKSRESCTIYVLGHTDDLGSEQYNASLSWSRVARVLSILQGIGVSRERLAPFAYGEKHPADRGTSEEARARNRRVELRAVNPY